MRRDHNLTPPKKRLAPLAKVKLAAAVWIAFMAEQLDEKEAGNILREQTGTQWSILTCMQYLSGKEALEAIAVLPDGWAEDGLNKPLLENATKLAAMAVANAHPDGVPLCASDLAKQYREQGTEGDNG